MSTLSRYATYKYDPLEDPDRETRLLMLLPAPQEEDPLVGDLVPITFCEESFYPALSYCWGEDQPNNSIEIQSWNANGLHGGYLPVTTSLEAALRQMRRDWQDLGGSEGLGLMPIWIDALCIDQKNNSEKGHQVRNMGRVYRNAKLVYIWLGEEKEESELAMDLIQGYDDACGCGLSKEKGEDANIFSSIQDKFWLENKDRIRHWHALWKLSNRPWFTRRWIIQEKVFADVAMVFCGKKRVCWDALRNSIAYLTRHDFCKEECIQKRSDGIRAIFGLDRVSHFLESGNLPPLEALLDEFHLSLATDPRDAIYSLISMASDIDLENWCPDYSNDNSVLSVFLKALIHVVNKSHRLDIICRSANHRPSFRTTWLPWFGHNTKPCYDNCSLSGYQGSSNSISTFGREFFEHPERVYLTSGSTKPWMRISHGEGFDPVTVSGIENIWVDNKITNTYLLASSSEAKDSGDSFHPDAFFSGLSKSTIHVLGYRVDTIKRVGSWPETGQTFDNRMGIPDYWMHMASGTSEEACVHPHTCTFKDFGKVPKAFWQALVGNRAVENDDLVEIPREWTSLLEKGLISTHACLSPEEE